MNRKVSTKKLTGCDRLFLCSSGHRARDGQSPDYMLPLKLLEAARYNVVNTDSAPKA